MRYLGGCGSMEFNIYPYDLSRELGRDYGQFILKVEPVIFGDDLCLKVEMRGYHKDGTQKELIDTIMKLENGFPKPPPVEIVQPPIPNPALEGVEPGRQACVPPDTTDADEMKAIKETLQQVLDELKKKGHSPEHAKAILMAREQENIEELQRALDREHELLNQLGVTRPNPVRGWVMNRRRREGWFRRLLRRIFTPFTRRNWS